MQPPIELPTDRPLTDYEIAVAVADAILNNRLNPGREEAFQPSKESLFARLGIPEGAGRTGEISDIRRRLRDQNPDLDFRLEEFCWRLVGPGFLVPQRGAIEFRPTRRGHEYLASLDATALTPGGLDAKLDQLGFAPSEPPRQYARLSQECFLAGHYESSVVMLGVASEALINDLADRLAKVAPNAMPGLRRRPARKTAVENLNWVTDALTNRLRDLRTFLTAKGATADWVEPLANVLRGTGEAIRQTRNDLGHPRGVNVGQEDALQLLTLFPRFASGCAAAFNAL